MCGRIIFHYPLPLNERATSASGIRPIKMLESFHSLGYEVDIVDGYASDRRRKINAISERIKNGVHYDFMYSESATIPTILTEPDHLPRHPLLDFYLFRLCRRNGVPTALFYRDIYWRFPEYNEGMTLFKRLFAKACYWLDILMYRFYIDRLYLPSMAMAEYVPLMQRRKLAALPPGHAVTNMEMPERSDHVRILYVGGVGSHYEMHELFRAVRDNGAVQLTVCTRKSEWESVSSRYATVMAENIRIVHLSGHDLAHLYNECDVAALYVRPLLYRQFAVPFKLFEYLGWGKPIIASEGTLSGEFVKANGVGWSIPYDHQSLLDLLERLSSDPGLIDGIHENVKKKAILHSWESRAKMVANDLVVPE